MATQQTHISVSFLLSLLYSLAGVFLFGVYVEQALLAAIIILVAGVLPNIDDKGSAPAKELGGLLAAVAPLALLEYFPEVRSGGVVRITLVVVCCYILTKVLIGRSLGKFLAHRGMMHSIPAALLTAELTYLLFWDLHWFDRTYLAAATLVGYSAHLLVDAYTNLDLMARVMGRAEKKSPALKILGPSFGTTLAMYTGVLVLGWYIARDLYPNLQLYGGIKY